MSDLDPADTYDGIPIDDDAEPDDAGLEHDANIERALLDEDDR